MRVGFAGVCVCFMGGSASGTKLKRVIAFRPDMQITFNPLLGVSGVSSAADGHSCFFGSAVIYFCRSRELRPVFVVAADTAIVRKTTMLLVRL